MNRKLCYLLFLSFFVVDNMTAEPTQLATPIPFINNHQELSTKIDIDTNDVLIEILSFEAFEKHIQSRKDNKLYIYNFWATWCKPCVEEIPYFEQLATTYPNNVEVILVSLDDPATAQKNLPAFIEQMRINSKVIVVKNFGDKAISTINSDWDGAIPASLFINPVKEVHEFKAQSFTFSALEKLLLDYSNQ